MRQARRDTVSGRYDQGTVRICSVSKCLASAGLQPTFMMQEASECAFATQPSSLVRGGLVWSSKVSAPKHRLYREINGWTWLMGGSIYDGCGSKSHVSFLGEFVVSSRPLRSLLK